MPKRALVCLLIGAVLLSGGCISVNAKGNRLESPCPRCEACQKGAQVVRHVVLFKLKAGTTPEQLREIEQGFCALSRKVDGICGFEWGTNIGKEERAQGFTHCFVVTFKDEASLEAYGPHPAHEEYKALLGPHLDKLLVIDYWTKR